MRNTLALALGVMLVASACGGSEETASATPIIEIDGQAVDENADTSAEGPTSGADSTADTSDEEMALEFAECMRDNGMPEFADPAVNADGSIDLQANQPAMPDLDRATIDTALDACGDLIAGASFLPGADLDQSEIEDNLLAFAQCLRGLGHEINDPDFSRGITPGPDGPGGMFAGVFDPTDPANADDIAQCQQEVFGAAGIGGQGGN